MWDSSHLGQFPCGTAPIWDSSHVGQLPSGSVPQVQLPTGTVPMLELVVVENRECEVLLTQTGPDGWHCVCFRRGSGDGLH